MVLRAKEKGNIRINDKSKKKRISLNIGTKASLLQHDVLSEKTGFKYWNINDHSGRTGT